MYARAMRAVIALGGAVLVCLAVPVQTGAQDEPGTLTVYSSLPLSGPAKPQTQAIVRGARLALEEAGGTAGGRPVRYVSLNDATRGAGSWVPRRTARNAIRAAQDDSAIAYIGEFNSGASAVSMPILNEAGVPQISPSNTAIGLTRGGLGAERGEPAKYNPTGLRHYFRLAPNDRVQAAALAAAMRNRGCRRVSLIDDGEIYGRAITGWARRAARRLGLRVVARATIDRRARSYRGLARRLRGRRTHCAAYGGITASGAVRLFRALAGTMPKAQLFGSDGIAESGFTGRLPRRVARRVLVIVSTLAPSAYPAQGQDFLRRYSARYGDPNPDPYAIYGYEAMRLVLDAVSAAGPRRRAVVEALRAMPQRAGAIGSYRFDRFGDTTLRTFGLYRVRGGALEWAGTVDAP
jgi:branched-chain amino acid transport system substrate-binding protein